MKYMLGHPITADADHESDLPGDAVLPCRGETEGEFHHLVPSPPTLQS
jgi:hypothetical protein